jgi:V8-like Glu-specific endopeptidase
MRTLAILVIAFLCCACSEAGAPFQGQPVPGILGGEIDTTHLATGALTLHPSGAVICSATLIDPRYVLTAAHCLADREPGVLRFFMGDSVMNVDGRRVRIASFAVHPDYNPDLLVFDVAVLKLSESIDDVVPFSPGAWPPDADTVLFSGYGRIDDGTSGTRYQADVTLASTYPSMFSTVYTEALRTGICFADSGAPALHESVDGVVIIGLVSGVLAYDAQEAPCIGTYNVTRIEPLLPFIAEQTEQPLPDCRLFPGVCICGEACNDSGICDNARCAVRDCSDGFNCLADCPAFDGACFNDCYVATRSCALSALYQFIDCGSRNCGAEPAASASDCLKNHCNDELNRCFYSDSCDSNSSPEGPGTDEPAEPTPTDSSDIPDTNVEFPAPHAVSGCGVVAEPARSPSVFSFFQLLFS